MDLLADISFGAAVVVGIVLISGFLLVANLRDTRNARHPGGARGRLRDEMIVLGPVVPMLAFSLLGAVRPELRDADWWLPALVVVVVFVGAGVFLPTVRHARARLTALRGEPSQ